MKWRDGMYGLWGVALLSIAAPAAAQSGRSFDCRTGNLVGEGTPGSRPVPAIARYAVSAADNPLPAGAGRETREASVVGGDAERGWLIIDLKFDAAIPQGCALPIKLTLARDSGNPGDQAVINGLIEVLDGMEEREILPHLRGAMAFAGEGTDQARLRIPIRATTTSRPKAHALKLVVGLDYAGGLPLTVNVVPLPALALVAPSGPLAGGSVTVLRAEHRTRLLPGTARMPVMFRLSSGTLGRWQAPLAPGSLESRGGWDDRFTPLRAEQPFVAASSGQAVSGTVSATFGGSTVTMPITVAAAAPPPPPPAAACDPVFSVTAVAGGLRVAVSDRAKGKCPVFLVRPRPLGTLAAPFSTAAAKLALPAGSTGPTAPASFTLTPKGLAGIKAGTRVEFEIVPEGASGSVAAQRVGITLSALDVARIAGKGAGTDPIKGTQLREN
jgi:hypothetical protein